MSRFLISQEIQLTNQLRDIEQQLLGLAVGEANQDGLSENALLELREFITNDLSAVRLELYKDSKLSRERVVGV